MDIETLVNEILTEMKCSKDEWRKMSLQVVDYMNQFYPLNKTKHFSLGSMQMKGNMRGTNMPSRSSGEGVQRQGSRLESTQLGSDSRRTELRGQEQTTPHNRGNQDGLPPTNPTQK